MVKKDGMIFENSFFKGKEGRVGFRKTLLPNKRAKDVAKSPPYSESNN